LLLVVGLAGCTDQEQISGAVRDPWGHPVSGATVIMEGVFEQAHTDGDGRFSFPLRDGTFRLMAGHDGFIKATATVAHPPGEDGSPPSPEMVLYPDPPGAGFFAVGQDALEPVEGSAIRTVGTELRAFTGLRDVGALRLNGGHAQAFVFTSHLRPSELAQLDLQLHRLEFVDDAALPGALGDQDVAVNLWVARDAVPFDLKGLLSRDDYLVTTRARLVPGIYAFHTNGVLTSRDVETLDKLPREMRVAWPFEVR
jgi:hypothetical protein